MNNTSQRFHMSSTARRIDTCNKGRLFGIYIWICTDIFLKECTKRRDSTQDTSIGIQCLPKQTKKSYIPDCHTVKLKWDLVLTLNGRAKRGRIINGESERKESHCIKSHYNGTSLLDKCAVRKRYLQFAGALPCRLL